MITNYNEKPVMKKGEPFRLNMNGLDFAFEKKLYMKLFTMCKRITEDHPILDACLTNSGYEGDGKTNTSLIEAIIAHKMINTSIHLFFKTSSCIEFAKSTEKKIIILDEPSFESLSTDSLNSLNKDLLRLTSTMRKKRHFLIINFAKFWKFPEFLVVDRALGMIHMDSKNGKQPGKFLYIKKRDLEKLWNGKKKANKLLYGKLKTFRGRLPYLMEDIFDNFNIQVEGVMNATMDDYDREKDIAIETIGKPKKSKMQMIQETKLGEVRQKISGLAKHFGLKQEDLASYLDVDSKRLREWKKINPELLSPISK